MKKTYAPNTMLDSGAFSAWYHKESLDIDAYIEFIKAHRKRFFSIVCLDVIPGERATMAKTHREIEAAAAQSDRNHAYMQSKGVDAIPVFHQGESWTWLEKMLDRRIPYIGISPYLKAKQPSIMAWMDECFTRLSDKNGAPLCKTHGFGVTGHQLVRRYPWYSVDSTSWALSAGYGNILMPRFTPKGADFTHPVQFNISDRDTAGNNSMVNIGSIGRLLVDKYFADLGLDFSGVRNFQSARLVINASYFLGLEKQLGVTPFAFRKHGFKARPASHRSAPFDYSPRVFLATMIKIQQQGMVLSKLRAPNRLISYYDCRRYEPEQVEEYTRNGFLERDPFIYKAGTKRGELRRRMLFLKRLSLQNEEGISE